MNSTTVNPSTPEQDLNRLRSDLDTIHSAMGVGLPFGQTDIRFMWSFAVAVLFSFLGDYFGAREGIIRTLIISPVLLVGIGYIAFTARKKRNTNPVRSAGYRLGLIGGGIILLVIVPLTRWADSIGVPFLSFQALLAVFSGSVTVFVAAFVPYFPAGRSRQILYGFIGVMVIVLGLLLPSSTRDTFGLVWGLWGFVACAGNAAVMQFFLNREAKAELR